MHRVKLAIKVFVSSQEHYLQKLLQLSLDSMEQPLDGDWRLTTASLQTPHLELWRHKLSCPQA